MQTLIKSLIKVPWETAIIGQKTVNNSKEHEQQVFINQQNTLQEFYKQSWGSNSWVLKDFSNAWLAGDPHLNNSFPFSMVQRLLEK